MKYKVPSWIKTESQAFCKDELFCLNVCDRKFKFAKISCTQTLTECFVSTVFVSLLYLIDFMRAMIATS